MSDESPYRPLHVPAPVPRRPIRVPSEPPAPTFAVEGRPWCERMLEWWLRQHGYGWKWRREPTLAGDVTLWIFDLADDAKRRRLELDMRELAVSEVLFAPVLERVEAAIGEIWDDWFDPERWEALGELLTGG